jgi:hypothetical protein
LCEDLTQVGREVLVVGVDTSGYSADERQVVVGMVFGKPRSWWPNRWVSMGFRDWSSGIRRTFRMEVGCCAYLQVASLWGVWVALAVWPRRMATWDGGGFDRTFHRDTKWHEMTLPEGLTR